MGYQRPTSDPSIRAGGARAREAALLAAVAAAGFAMTGTAKGESNLDSPEVREEIRHAHQLSRAFQAVARSVAPSVVSIEVVDAPPYNGGAAGNGMMPDGRIEGLPARRGGATGVIIDDRGFIVTNNHVIEGADEILVEFHDGRRVEGRLVGSDVQTDIAIVGVEAGGLVPARFGDSSASRVGEWILAVGSPFGLDQTVTAGIISAIGRDRMGLARYESFIQTDAAINPGNSGGPMVNLDGEVIGINTAIRSSSGGSNGIGFAIPSAMVERVTSSLIESGRVERGWLGVSIQALNDDLAASFGFDGTEAVLVSGVVPGTPAAEAGLAPGDIITSIGGERTTSPTTLGRAVGKHDPSDEVLIEFIRNGRGFKRSVRLIERPEDLEAFIRARRDGAARIGLMLKPVEESLAGAMDLDGAEGVQVEAVTSGGPSDRSGLRPGDVIHRLNGEDIEDRQEFERLLSRGLDGEGEVRVLVQRGELRYFLLIDPGDN